MVTHEVVLDTIHVVTNETVWQAPDSVGRQYPLKTIRREIGGQRMKMSEGVYQARDTVYHSVDDSRLTSNESRTQGSDGKSWVPWLIIIGMVGVGVVIIVIIINVI